MIVEDWLRMPQARQLLEPCPPAARIFAGRGRLLAPAPAVLRSSANKVASRLAWSCSRLSQLLPLDAAGVDGLIDEDIERLDAFLYRFNSLTTTALFTTA